MRWTHLIGLRQKCHFVFYFIWGDKWCWFELQTQNNRIATALQYYYYYCCLYKKGSTFEKNEKFSQSCNTFIAPLHVLRTSLCNLKQFAVKRPYHYIQHDAFLGRGGFPQRAGAERQQGGGGGGDDMGAVTLTTPTFPSRSPIGIQTESISTSKEP